MHIQGPIPCYALSSTFRTIPVDFILMLFSLLHYFDFLCLFQSQFQLFSYCIGLSATPDPHTLIALTSYYCLYWKLGSSILCLETHTLVLRLAIRLYRQLCLMCSPFLSGAFWKVKPKAGKSLGEVIWKCNVSSV